ncbi:MAG: MFS transporter [Candidatus Humimicrobiaceae bacterium]
MGSFGYPFLSLLLTLKLGFSKSDAGLITTISVTLGGVGLLFGGKLADRFGRKKIIIILSTLSAACFCGLRVSGNFKNYCIFDNCSYFFLVWG